MISALFPALAVFIGAAVLVSVAFAVWQAKRTGGVSVRREPEANGEFNERRMRFYVRVFFAIALFAFLQIGLVLLLPWIVFGERGGSIGALGFVVIMATGYVYAVRKGLVNWE
ncbi:MAG: NADH-quinone oxidoreductase subunit A [Pseudomonadota bacterium]